MKKISYLLMFALAVLGLTSAAEAQSWPSTWKSYTQTGNPADIIPSTGTSNSVAAWFEKKVDVSSGTLTSPTITGGAITGANVGASTSTATGASNSRTISSHEADRISVLDFGAACNGTTDAATDDTAAFNKALTYAATANAAVSVPARGCKVLGPVTIPAGVSLTGAGFNSTSIYAGNTGANIFVLGGQGATIRDMDIKFSAVNPTSGDAIDASTKTPFLARIYDVMIESPYIGVDMSGNNVVVDHVEIQGASGYGIRIGHATTSANTVDPRITNTTIGNADGTIAGMLVEDAGGLYLTNNDIVGGQIGTLFRTGANQQITWTFADNTVLGDTGKGVGLEIQNGDSTGIIRGLRFANSWSSNNANDNVLINEGAGGTLENISFGGFREYGGSGNGVTATYGTGIRVTDSEFCGGNSGATQIYLGSGVTNSSVSGNNFAYTCGNYTSNRESGVSLVGGNNYTSITGNNFAGITTPINIPATNSGVSLIIGSNNPLDNNTSSISAASGNLAFSQGYGGYVITSTDGTDVSNISYGWSGRHVLVIPQVAMTFATGGSSGTGICNTYTATANIPFSADFYGCWYLH